jgi:predicted cobalt transporter CbtA
MHSSFTAILRRGLLAGLLAGGAAALVSLLLVETPIRAALRIEQARTHAAGEHSHEEMFSRSTQVVGGMVAVLIVGLAIGTIFAVVFARTQHRLPARTSFGRSLQLAAGGFFAVSLLPALKYPANPPGVGEPGTVGDRTLAYVFFIAAGIVILCAAYYLRKYLISRGRPPAHTATATAGAVVLLVVVALWAWPANPDPIPSDVPAGLLWQFRLYSLAELATLWTVLGFTFGLLSQSRTATASVTTAPATTS